MSIGMVSQDGKKEFYAEFTDYDLNQIDKWLEDNILSNFILNDMLENSFKKKNNLIFLRGDSEWVVNNNFGIKSWLSSFNEKIIFAACGNTYDWVLFRSLLKVKYNEELPNYIDAWSMDIVSLYRWEGFEPYGENFKEQFIGKKDISGKHNALVDAHSARKMYFKLEMIKKNRK